MRVSYDEDLANHIDPESCVCSRKAAGEALTGESAVPLAGKRTVKITETKTKKDWAIFLQEIAASYRFIQRRSKDNLGHGQFEHPHTGFIL